jgi:hypothetical protein
VFEVIRACLAGGAEEEDDAKEDSEVSVSLLRLAPRLPLSESLLVFAFTLVLAFSFSLFADVKGVAAARRIFGGHVTVLVE